MKRLVVTLAVAAVLAAGAFAAAAADDPAKVAQYRQTLMKTQNAHFEAIVAILRGEVSFASHLKDHADAAQAISEMVIDVFPEGSAVGDSRAKPEIWQNWDKFLEVYDTYKAETAKLAEVAAGGDLAAVGAQLDNVGKACGGCHKLFREKKQ